MTPKQERNRCARTARGTAAWTAVCLGLALNAAPGAAAVITNYEAVLNPSGALGEKSYCVLGEAAKVAVQLDAGSSKYVRCRWRLYAHGVKANGKPKDFILLAGKFKRKPVDGPAPLEFMADVSTKLNKKLGKRAIQKKLTGTVTDGTLQLKTIAKPYDGGREKAITDFATTIYLLPPTNIPYMVIDISAGPWATNYPVTILAGQPALGEIYKTTSIILRKLANGVFRMGSATNELGRDMDEGPQRTVTLTKDFYMGVFEITQAQYSNVMGQSPAYFTQGTQGTKRPVEQVSWNMIRGGAWPSGTPTNSTFLGRLRERTGIAFDLPTEAQWEYACRAGTTTAWNNGTTITNVESDANLNKLGRYWFNDGYRYSTNLIKGAHAVVGSYTGNAWDLYDMHGNVAEWCLDWNNNYSGDETDPVGPGSGLKRTLRGGSWYEYAAGCRSAERSSDQPGTGDYRYGFRITAPGEVAQ